jgi:transcriptional regulator with XRE-family HTH domain
MQRKKLTVAEEFKTMLDELKERDSFHIDGAKVELSEQIYIAMQDSGVSEAELSRRLGVSRAYVNKILKGTANLTIESLVKIGRALGGEFKFELVTTRSRMKKGKAVINYVDFELRPVNQKPVIRKKSTKKARTAEVGRK